MAITAKKKEIIVRRVIREEIKREFGNTLSKKEYQLVENYLLEKGGLFGALGRGVKAIGGAIFGSGEGATSQGGIVSATGELLFGKGRGTPEQVSDLRGLMSGVRAHLRNIVSAFSKSNFPPYKQIGTILRATQQNAEKVFASNNPKAVAGTLKQALTVAQYMQAFQGFADDFDNILESHEDDLNDKDTDKAKKTQEEVLDLINKTILRDLGAANYKNLGTLGRLAQSTGLVGLARVPKGLTPQDISKSIVDYLKTEFEKKEETAPAPAPAPGGSDVTTESKKIKKLSSRVLYEAVQSSKELKKNLRLQKMLTEAEVRFILTEADGEAKQSKAAKVLGNLNSATTDLIASFQQAQAAAAAAAAAAKKAQTAGAPAQTAGAPAQTAGAPAAAGGAAPTAESIAESVIRKLQRMNKRKR